MRAPCLLLALWAFPLAAQVRPSPGAGDPRLQTIAYDENQIVQLNVGSSNQLMVAFAAGERIETIAVGDSASWQVSPGKRGDFLFIKNVNPSGSTNMTVVTDARTYSFELLPDSGYSAETPYLVRFSYPSDSPSPAIVADRDAPHYKYSVSGSSAIRPVRVFSEGGNTIVEWQDGTDLPAVFARERGVESLVNGEMRDGRFVVAGSPEQLVFRLDRETAIATRRKIRLNRR